MTSSDEDAIEFLRKKKSQQEKPIARRRKKTKTISAGKDKSNSETGGDNMLLPVQKKRKYGLQNSESDDTSGQDSDSLKSGTNEQGQSKKNFRNKGLTVGGGKSLIRKNKLIVPENDSSDSEGDGDVDKLLSFEKKHLYMESVQDYDSESDDISEKDSDSDSSEPDTDDQRHCDEKSRKNLKLDHLQSRKTLSKEKVTSLKQKTPKTSKEQLNASESDSNSEPKVRKTKKVDGKLTCHENDDEYTAIKEELSHMSFEELQKLRDRLGVKVYNQVVRGGRNKQDLSAAKPTFSRENKNRPMEMSSKRPVSFYRDVIPVKKKVMRDPRFDDLSGNFNEAIFRSSYAFVDDIKKKEKEKLSKKLKKTKNAEKKQELKFLINRMNQQESAHLQKQKRKEMEKEWNRKELSRVREGKNPYFLKKGDLRKLELAEKFKELKKTGKLDKYLGKKRKKNASKEKKKLPSS